PACAAVASVLARGAATGRPTFGAIPARTGNDPGEPSGWRSAGWNPPDGAASTASDAGDRAVTNLGAAVVPTPAGRGTRSPRPAVAAVCPATVSVHRRTRAGWSDRSLRRGAGIGPDTREPPARWHG